MSRQGLQLQVLLNDLAVELDLHQPGIRDLLSRLIEPWSLEDKIESLPLPRWLRCIDQGRMSLIEMMIPREQFRAWIDPAAFASGQALGPVAVNDLDLVQALQLHSRVRLPRDQELEMGLEIAKLLPREEISSSSRRTVDQNAPAADSRQAGRIGGIEPGVACDEPVARGLAPPFQLMAADQRDPAQLIRSRQDRSHEHHRPEKHQGKTCS